MKLPSRFALPTAVLCLASALGLEAQAPANVPVTGLILDPSGSALPRATLHLRTSSAEQTAPTDALGRFTLLAPPGDYTLEVDADGFEPFLQPHLAIAPGHPVALRLTLRIATVNQVVDVPSDPALANDADSNKSALTFKGTQLDTFANDPATMQLQLQMLAGSSPGDAPQLYVDGFSNGTMPPKESIREIHINQNPFSAQSSDFGRGRIEVFTKPGSGKLHGSVEFNYGNSTLNARNPYTGPQPAYNNDYATADLSGPLGRKSSFFLSVQRSDLSQNEAVNAVTLDPGLNLLTVSEPVRNQVTSQTYSARLDRQFGANDTLIGRYTWSGSNEPATGVGLLVLPSEAYRSASESQTLQLSETHLFGARVVLDGALQYIRSRLSQTPASTAPTLIVQGSFSGGGSPTQAFDDHQDRLELHQYLTLQQGKHLIRTGLRYRLLREGNLASANFNGQYIFPDITTYRNTLIDLQNGLSSTAIRAKGDGASQFSLSAGTPSVALVTGDLGVYSEDEWKATPTLTLSFGLRLESQSAIPDHLDLGPRVGVAYSLKFRKSAKEPFFVIRGGFGIFYKRFAGADLLTSLRENGTTEQTYIVTNPDTFPAIPAPAALGAAIPSTVYRVSPRLHAPVQLQGLFGIEHSFGRIGSLAATWYPRRQFHEFDSLNLNAPLPGTGARPFGTTQNIYQFSSDGISHGQDFNLNGNLNLAKWVSAWVFGSIDHDQTDTSGADSFPSNSYHPGFDRADYDGFSSRKLFSGINAHARGVSLNLFFAARSRANFNITTGADNNGDSVFNDRPAFATDLTRASVVRTALGTFDLDPIPGQTVIPRNFGRAPAFTTLELYANKDFRFGTRPTPPAGAPANAPRPDPPFRFQLGLGADNLLNTNNPGPPIGVLTSPYFGRSISLNSPFSGNTAANRALTLRAAFFF